MSIINLEKIVKNEQLVYCNIDNKIIKCICLSELYKYISKNYDNEYLGVYVCDKVKIITIYDIYKNIIHEPIQTILFNYSIKINMILENLKKKYIFFSKTFIGSFIKHNKLNGILYDTDYKGTVYRILYNTNYKETINITVYNSILLEINHSMKTFNIYNNEKKRIHKIQYNKSFIYYKNYNDEITYNIYNNNIEIRKGKFPFLQVIHYNMKNLKIFRMEKYYKNTKIQEIRNDNNEITHLIEYINISNKKENFSSNNTNPPFSKLLKNNCIELIDYYKKNINNCIKLIEYCLNKETPHNLLLNCKLEIINSK